MVTEEKIKRRFTKVFLKPGRKAILLDCSGSMEPLWRIAWRCIYHIIRRLHSPVAMLGFYSSVMYPEAHIDTYGNAKLHDIWKILLAKYGKMRIDPEPPDAPISFTGSTPLWDAIDYMIRRFPDHDIIVITDGFDNTSTLVKWLPENDRVFAVILYSHSSSEEQKRRDRLMSVYAHLIVKNDQELEEILQREVDKIEQ